MKPMSQAEQLEQELAGICLSEVRKAAIRKALKEKETMKKGRCVLRAISIAAALCVLLTVSALAVSPGLREQLAAALGAFAPYAQEMEEGVCVENGVEIRVLSAMADRSIVKVYVQVRDLKEDRLTANLSTRAYVERGEEAEREALRLEGGGYSFSDKCVGFDEESGTALLEISTFGTFPSDLEGMRLQIESLYPTGDRKDGSIGGDEHWTVDLNVEVISSREIALTGMLDGKELVKAQISALGITLVTSGERGIGENDLLSVYLEDGTIVHPRLLGAGGTGLERITCWAFDEPVDSEQVTGLSIQSWMIPLDGAAAGEGYWLSELPE